MEVTSDVIRRRREMLGQMGSVVGGCAVFGVAGLDFTKLSLVFLYVVGDGVHELLSVLRAHDHAAYDRSLGHAGSREDEVDQELVGAVTDHCEVAVFAIGKIRAELDLKLILVFVSVCHCVFE